MKLLLLLSISIACMSAKSLHISELAKKTISPHRHAAWAEWKEKYFPGEGDNTKCDDEEHMKQWEKNNGKIEKNNSNPDYTFKDECNMFCCFTKETFFAQTVVKSQNV